MPKTVTAERTRRQSIVKTNVRHFDRRAGHSTNVMETVVFEGDFPAVQAVSLCVRTAAI